MALSGSSMAGNLLTAMVQSGLTGDSSKDFADAVGEGSVASVVGKPFTTLDVGSGGGVGKGSGTGLLLIPGTIFSSILASAAASMGGGGPDLLNLCIAIEQALIQEMLNASLNSDHLGTLTGVGSIVPGSISIVPSEWGANVFQAGVSFGLLGNDFRGFADAIGDGSSPAFVSAIGIVTITGTGTPSGPPGTGTGTIS